MTTADAAAVLGVSARQVERMVASRRLVRAGVVGRSVLVDAGSLHRHRVRGAARGRPWSAHTVAASLDLLRSGTTERLGASQRSRLKARMRDMSAAELVRAVARRSDTVAYHTSASLLDGIRDRVVLTAGSAVDVDAGIAAALGLAGSVRQAVDGYTEADGAQRLVDRFFLTPDPGGNVTLRQAEVLPGERVADLVTVAVDLAESLDVRERFAGLALINERLASLR